jgi:hypothetical protein
MSDSPYTDTTQRYRVPSAEIPGCTLVQDLIPLYLDGEVSHESHALMADHLAQCERCSGYLAGARSVRSQILKEQQTLRQSAASGPSVAAVRQSATQGFGAVFLSTLLLLIYLAGAWLALLGVSDAHSGGPLFAGGLLMATGLIGLASSGQTQSLLWRVLMLLTGVAGGGVLLSAMFAPWYGFMNGRGIVVGYGLALIGIAVWGLWPRASASPGTTTQALRGPNGALLTAILATLAALACAGLITVGLMLFLFEPFSEPRMIGAAIALAGGIGLLLLNQRMGWLPQLATTHAVRQAAGYALLIGGALLGSLLLSAVLGSVLPLLVGLALAGVLIVFGLRLARRGDSSGRQS